MYIYLCMCLRINKGIIYMLYVSMYMVNITKVKLYEYKSRHSINLPSDFVKDSQFPFQVNEELIARISGKQIIIEKAIKQEESK
jgi:hypothetical protein